MFALVDCNNFYASCERVFRPDLNGKPVVVLSNNDGCVIARSNEAKEAGIPMGAPAFKFSREMEEKNIAVFSSNYALYGDMSHRIMSMLTEFTPDVEVYSIDEAFLQFKGFDHIRLEEYGLQIRKRVTQSTGVPISIGFAPTKALAKVANKIAKKFTHKTGGVYVIDSEEKRIKALKWLKTEDVWGIGRRYAKRLQALGITTAYQFTQQPDEWVRKQMSVVGLRLKHDLEGKPTLELDEVENKKNIATTRSFEHNITAFEPLRERVITFAVSCAEKLRRQQSSCNALMVFVHTNSHRKDLKQYSKNRIIKLPFATNSAIEIAKFAVQALESVYKEGYEYKKAGVIVMDFTPQSQQQLSLFDEPNPKHEKLMQAVDQMNRKIGQDKIKLAGQALDRTWKMRQEHLSPRYTTRLTEIITVKV